VRTALAASFENLLSANLITEPFLEPNLFHIEYDQNQHHQSNAHVCVVPKRQFVTAVDMFHA